MINMILTDLPVKLSRVGIPMNRNNSRKSCVNQISLITSREVKSMTIKDECIVSHNTQKPPKSLRQKGPECLNVDCC